MEINIESRTNYRDENDLCRNYTVTLYDASFGGGLRYARNKFTRPIDQNQQYSSRVEEGVINSFRADVGDKRADRQLA